MAWHLKGTYFENCNCDSVCPCTTSGLTAAADNDRCHVVFLFNISSGEVDGVDVAGLTVGMVADTPSPMVTGNWRVGLFMDAAASAEQAAALGAVFAGQRGGAFEGLAPLITENLGVETVPIQYKDDGRTHRVKVGDILEIEIEDFVSPLDETGKGVTISGIGFPADTVTVATATKSRGKPFGLDFSNVGKNGHAAPFAWSA